MKGNPRDGEPWLGGGGVMGVVGGFVGGGGVFLGLWWVGWVLVFGF